MSDGGKGSAPRPYSVSQDQFANNWNATFAKPKGTCGCGRSPTGNCVGWHGLTEEEFQWRKELYETGRVDLAGQDID
jgi:hypothetical protein